MNEQLDMFEFTHKDLPKKDKIKLGTFFSGIGAPETALMNIGVDYDLQFFSEIDKYAIQSYMAIHNEPIEKSVGSISDLKGSDLPYCDMWFGGFPCQDISLAGKGKGFSLETESRSSLGWEMIRLASEVETKPTYIVFENVAAIFNNTHRPVLNLFKRDLEALGYTLYNKLLNTKDYGIPQNRNRYFLIAILGEYSFKFPRKQKLKLRLKDLLEDEVDEKYYLSDKQIKSIESWNAQQKPLERMEETERKQISPTLLARGQEDLHSGIILIPEATKKGYAEAQDGDGIYIDRPHQKRGVVQKGMTPTIKTSGDDIGVVVRSQKEMIREDLKTQLEYGIKTKKVKNAIIDGVIVKGNYSKSNHNASRVVSEEGIAPTVMENHGTVTAVELTGLTESEKKMITEDGNVKRYINSDVVDEFNEGDCADISFPNGYNKGNRVFKGHSPALNNTTIKSFVTKTPLRIRKLTPKECFRLQGFSDQSYENAAMVVSNSQLYKQAGNSITVNVLEAIFTNLLLGGNQ